MTKYIGTSGIDTFAGADNIADEFDFAVTDLSNADAVSGGTGATIDFLKFTTAGTVAAAAFANVSHIEQLVLANGTNDISLTDALVGSSDSNHVLTVSGGSGDDTINASAVTTAANRVVFRSGSGNDTLTGGAGNDVFYFAPTDLTSSDTVNAGAGTDNLVFTAAGTVSATALSHVSAIEAVVLANGTNAIALTDAMVSSATSHILTVNGGTGDDTIDASAVTTASNRLLFRSGAGSDTLTGGTGNDVFYFAATDLTNGDTVNGGAGIDGLIFTAPGTVSAAALAHVSGIETITLANGTNSIALTDALVSSATGSILTVNDSSGDDTINASAVTTATNRVAFHAGPGNDTLTGGAGNDLFFFIPGDLTSSDVVVGGGGYDNLTFTLIGANVTSTLSHVSGIEAINLANGTNSLVLLDALVGSADSHILTVNGGTGNDTIDATPVTTATNRVVINGGTGSDTLTGGAGNDVFRLALDAADTVAGGAGIDTLVLTNAGAFSPSDSTQHITGIEIVTLANGTNNFYLGYPMLHSALSGTITVNGGTGNDTISGADNVGQRMIFNSGTGSDTLRGEAGNDVFQFAPTALDATDSVAGGAGVDGLVFTAPGTIAASALVGVTGIEYVTLANGTNSITLRDSMLDGATPSLTVYGGTGNDTIDASGITTIAHRVTFNAHGGADHLTGGAGADDFIYNAVLDSTGNADGTAYDTVTGFQASPADVHQIDRFHLPTGALNTALAIANVGSGTLSSASFDTDMAAAIGSSLGAHQALLFHTTAGTLANHDFLVVNPDGAAGYTSGADYVIDITGYTGTFTTDNFI